MLTANLILAGTALLVSLTGSLPLGNLNVTAMRVAATEGLKEALLFAVGVAAIEVSYLLLTLSALQWLSGHKDVFTVLRIVTIVFMIAMAVGSFVAARRSDAKNTLLDNSVPRFWLGVTMSALNPLQVPFWMGWSVYLMSQGALTLHGDQFIFVSSAGIGTFIALLLFIVAGRKMAAWMNNHERAVNTGMGILFIFMAASQLCNLP